MIYWIIFILGDVVFNYYLIAVKKQTPVYLISFVYRGIAAIIHGAFMFYRWGTFDHVYDMSQFSGWELFKFWWPILSFQVSSFLVLFSPLLNLVRGKKFTYLGKESGWLDQIGTGDYPWVYWVIYWGSVLYLILWIWLIS